MPTYTELISHASEMIVYEFVLCCRFTCMSIVTTLTSLTDLVRCIPVP